MIVPVNASFTPVLITAPGELFQYKRIEVTVKSSTGPLGLGTRMARVSGVRSNPSPGVTAESIVSVADPGVGTSCP